MAQRLTGNAMSVLRQKLDSMIRSIFLLSVVDRQYRERLLRDSVNGNPWRGKDGKRKVTERLDENGFARLSAYHNYSDRDPFDSPAPEDLRNTAYYLHHYHRIVVDRTTKLSDIEFALPAVFEKTSANLECYVRDIEAGSAARS